jgi:hypothetical protein
VSFYPDSNSLSGPVTISGALTVTGLLTTQDGIANSGAAISSAAAISTTSGSVATANHFNGNGSAPSMAAGAGAGSSPPAPVVASGSSDPGGNATFGTGTSPAIGTQVAVTFANGFGSAGIGVVVTPENAAAAALGLYPSSIAGAGFNVSSTVAPTGSEPNTTYAFSWVVIG